MRIAWFSIPAYGHTNPTIGVVKELVSRGHEVYYYSFNQFKDVIEDAGAHFISCDKFDLGLNHGGSHRKGYGFIHPGYCKRDSFHG